MRSSRLPEDLLEQAEFLVRREPRRPKQASLRRAISTAYYALFHLITFEAAQLIGPNLEMAASQKNQRWFHHGTMKASCTAFAGSRPKPPLDSMLSIVSADLQLVAKTFVLLQEQRHTADYDLAATFSRLHGQTSVKDARESFQSWFRIRKSEEANLFALSLLLGSRKMDRKR